MTIEEYRENVMDAFVASGGRDLGLFIKARRLERLATNVYNIGLEETIDLTR